MEQFKAIIKQADSSPQFNLDMTDATKLVKDAGIVGAGAALTYLIAHISSLDFGQYTLLIIPAISTGLNILLKWAQNNNPNNQNNTPNYPNYPQPPNYPI